MIRFIPIVFSLIASVQAMTPGSGIIVVGAKSEPVENDPPPPKKPIPDYFNEGTKHPLGVRPDCSEKKFSISQLEDLAKKPGVNSTIDLLQNLPADTFQTFTLVTNSKSAQRGTGDNIVSEEWPRVLRTSADGKITFSYTCDPKSTTYNTVEVIYFDDKSREMKTMSIDFKNQNDHRVAHNDQKCLSCHATTQADGTKSVKPIWPQYFQWGGCEGKNSINFYGSNDDNMNPNDFRAGGVSNSDEYQGCTTDKLKERQKLEIESFKKFKEKNLGTGENNNPCYSTLPWAQPTGGEKSQYDPKKYSAYPYSINKEDIYASGNDDGLENYYIRPNLKFTEMYARLNAKRIAGIIEKSRNYERIKYFIALESSGCLQPEDEANIKKLMPGLNYTYKEPQNYGEGYQDPAVSNPLLYAYGQSIGIKDADWTLEFMGSNRVYNSAIPRRALNSDQGGPADTGMGEVAGGEIVSMLGESDQSIKPKLENAFTRGTEEGFGPQWSCIDDLGGPVREGFKGNARPLCVSLRESLKNYLLTATPDCEEPTQNKDVKNLTHEVNKITKKAEEKLKERGEQLVKDRCFKCHQAGKSDDAALSDMAFFANNKSSKEAENRINQRISSKIDKTEKLLKDGIMPADGNPLSAEDQEAVMLYMRSIKTKSAK